MWWEVYVTSDMQDSGKVYVLEMGQIVPQVHYVWECICLCDCMWAACGCVYVCIVWISWYSHVDLSIYSWQCTLQAFWKAWTNSADSWQKKNDELTFRSKDNSKERGDSENLESWLVNTINLDILMGHIA